MMKGVGKGIREFNSERDKVSTVEEKDEPAK